jgi:uncharacterized membrane protein
MQFEDSTSGSGVSDVAENSMAGAFGTVPTLLASFAASLVEFVEALTVVLAVGVVRGWRWALSGAAAAVMILMFLVGLFGQSVARIPLPIVQLVVGTLLLMFGLRWLRKAILRHAGVIAQYDEDAAYARETQSLRAAAFTGSGGWDRIAFATSFKIVMLEGIEVVFIVIAVGAGGRLLVPASLGAVAALLVVILLGVALHRPLARIPENMLKFGVGVLLTAFGTFWVGEGTHIEWPTADWSLLALIAIYLLVAQALVLVCRSRYRPGGLRAKTSRASRPKSALTSLFAELISLFVDDGSLAAGVLVWAGAAWWTFGHLRMDVLIQCALFVAGFSAVLARSALRAVGS